jgi:hypothetical protein
MNLLSLFPHLPETLLNSQLKKLNVLKLLKFFLEELLETLFLFNLKKMNHFDPHVGDTLCQIRAYKNLLLTAKTFVNQGEELKKNYESAKQSVYEFELLIKKNGKYSKELDESEKIFDFLLRKNLLFNVDSDLIFLVQEKILTDFSITDKGISKGIDYNKFSQKASISKSLSKRIIHCYQKHLAKYSCYFVLQLMNELPEQRNLKNYLIMFQKTDQDGRMMLPCYEVTKTLFRHLLLNRGMLLLIIDRKSIRETDSFHLFFMSNAERTEFILVNNAVGKRNTPCFVIKGISLHEGEFIETREEYIGKLIEIGVNNIVMANMACHPQYTDSSIDNMHDDPYLDFTNKGGMINLEGKEKNRIDELKNEFTRMKNLGLLVGCCKKNPIFFLIRHIFCSMSDNYIYQESAFLEKLNLYCLEN